MFGRGGGRALAEDEHIPFVGEIPLDPSLTASLDDGKTFVEKSMNSKSIEVLQKFVEGMLLGANIAAQDGVK